jgi:hypothetical protein
MPDDLSAPARAESPENCLARFRNPPSKYRSLVFWAWNSRLEEDEILCQIREMRDAGIGGFFIHSREGLETVYMGESWMRMTRLAALEARRLGMEAWLYDEDRWPSGTAGGKVPAARGDQARCKGLTLEVCDGGKTGREPGEGLLIRYRARVQGMAILSFHRLEKGETPEPGEKLLIVRQEVSGKSDWFNGEAPPDNLNPESVRCFIEETHERYKAVVGDLFGTTIPGIFTDEPSLHDRHASFPGNRGWIPWTSGFGDYFLERRGYDPLDLIPCVYFNGEQSPKIRHDYWRTITERYAESYSGEIGKWCRENGIAYTGHFLQEDKLGLASRVNGAVMPHYAHQDVPGIDILCEATDEYLTVKQCSSVARQYGKPAVLSETYGCTGWAFNFEGQKWLGDWQYALGVNRLVKHMALYTLKGCGKRDYPPSFNYNNGRWGNERIIGDYFGRISSLLMEGVPVRDVVVLHPASSAWSRLGCDPYGNPVRSKERDVPGINQYGYALNDLLKYLSSIHYDYDLGDELLMARDGSILGSKLVIARASYRALILPPMDPFFRSTFMILKEFLDAGGLVIAVRPLPFMLEGENRPEALELFRHPNIVIADEFPEIEKLLEARLPRRVSVSGKFRRQDGSILYLLKDLGEAWVLFLVNNDRHAGHTVDVDLRGILGDVPPGKALSLLKLDPLSGEAVRLSAPEGILRENMGQADSRLYLIEKKPERAIVTACGTPRASQTDIFYTSFSPDCTVQRNMPNALTLDTCCWHLRGGPESEEMELWQAQAQIRENLGMVQISHNGIPQRYTWIDKAHPQDGTEVSFVFRFNAAWPARGLDLVLEDAEHYRIFLNGSEVLKQKKGWFLDRAFDRIALPPLRAGENRLELSCAYRNRTQAEDIYLIGEIGVDTSRRIVPENKRIRTGDWTLQGYPHYAGSLSYEWSFTYQTARQTEGEGIRVILKLESFTASAVLVSVNGRRYEMPWKAAAEADITEALVIDSENRIAVEVLGSPRNLLGPFHLAQGETENTHDASFRTRGPEHTEGYHFHPYGLYAPPRLYLRRN